MTPSRLQHYGEWCLWNKEIAEIWLNHYHIKIEGTIEEYFTKRNKAINKAIVKEYQDTFYYNLIRYFKKESNLDLSEPDASEWRTP